MMLTDIAITYHSHIKLIENTQTLGQGYLSLVQTMIYSRVIE